VIDNPGNEFCRKRNRGHGPRPDESRPVPETEAEDHQFMQSRLLTLALGGLLTLGVTGAAIAQDNAPPAQEQGQPGPGGPRHMDPDKQLQHLTKELDLTTDQQSQIKPVLVDRQQKLQALFQDQSVSQDDRRTRARSIIGDSNSKIEAVLNDQQKQKFEAMQQRMRHGGPGGPPASPEGAPPQPQL
jgi:Spy/CpxP family protein refolding chaperone